jgi:hypothetical protein
MSNVNSLNDALVRVYNSRAPAAKLSFFADLVPTPNPTHTQVYSALREMYGETSYNDAMNLYLNNITVVWSGVIQCSEVLAGAAILQCGPIHPDLMLKSGTILLSETVLEV